MKVFNCQCKWRYIVGKKVVYGPMYPLDLPNDYGGWNDNHRMMSREEWEDQYADCARSFDHKVTKTD